MQDGWIIEILGVVFLLANERVVTSSGFELLCPNCDKTFRRIKKTTMKL